MQNLGLSAVIFNHLSAFTVVVVSNVLSVGILNYFPHVLLVVSL